MAEYLFFQIVLIALVSVGAQWLAWKLHIPAILFLLGCGFIFGPGLNLLQPDLLMGNLLHPAISAAVAIILFEGALHLRFRDLREASPAVRQIIFIGAPLGWFLISASAVYIGGMSWPVASVLGGMLVVTGPTVIMPLLRQARLNQKIGSVLKWEGIVNDPVGIIFAILAFEYFHTLALGPVHSAFYIEKGAIVFIVSTVSIATGYLVKYLFERGHMPEYLKAPFILSVILALFYIANTIMHESGLIAVTVLGITLTNIHTASLHEIHRFKETITIILVSGIFLLLTASLDVNILLDIGWRDVLFILSLLFVIRPMTVVIASLGSKLSLAETILISWIAPRGIVCAAMAGVLGPLLVESGFVGGEKILPIAFGVVLSSVILHSLTINPLARRLKLQVDESNGVLISGAHPWTVQLAVLLNKKNIPVMLSDNNFTALKVARMESIPVFHGELLSEETEFALELNRYSTLISATYSAPYNILLCDQFSHSFGKENVFQVPVGREKSEGRKISDDLTGSTWVDRAVTLEWLEQSFADGWRFRLTRIGRADKTSALIIPIEDENRKIVGYIDDSNIPHLLSKSGAYRPREDDMAILYELPKPDDTVNKSNDNGKQQKENL